MDELEKIYKKCIEAKGEYCIHEDATGNCDGCKHQEKCLDSSDEEFVEYCKEYEIDSMNGDAICFEFKKPTVKMCQKCPYNKKYENMNLVTD